MIQKLREHGVAITPVGASADLRVEEFRIDSTVVSEREFQGHRERTLYGSYHQVETTIHSGWYAVVVAQPLGRLAFSLLEPRSDDGLVNWNVMDAALENASVYPIRRR